MPRGVDVKSSASPRHGESRSSALSVEVAADQGRRCSRAKDAAKMPAICRVPRGWVGDDDES